MNDFIIKQIQTDAEIKAMGYVLYKSWHETYTGLIDCEYLKGITLEKCEKIASFQKDSALIAVIDGKVVGFVGFGAYRDDKNSDLGEIQAIYLLGEHQGKKIGYSLMNVAFERLAQYNQIALWVLKGNNKAIRFYEKYGFKLDGKEKKIMLGTENTELRMIYEKG